MSMCCVFAVSKVGGSFTKSWGASQAGDQGQSRGPETYQRLTV